jgi:hypothetical protein
MRPGTTDVPTAWRGLEDWLAKTLNENFRDQARTIVEIGVDWGYSLWWWQSIFPFAKIYGVDPYGDAVCEAWAGPAGRDAETHVKSWVKDAPRVELIKKLSVDAARDWKGGPIDLVHIDGSHAYEDVKADFWAWVPRLGHQRCIAFHDTISCHNTVGRFVMELEQRRYLGRFIYKTTQHYGMWVFQVGV